VSTPRAVPTAADPAGVPGSAGTAIGGTGGWLDDWLDRHEQTLIGVRRHLHRYPELGNEERATTEYVRERLADAGLVPRVLGDGVGLVCDIGSGERTIGLRADLDALPLSDPKDVPYRSTVEGVCHACGHDAHTAIVLGAGLALAAAPRLPGRVRLFFQPAEEIMPGGALDVIAAGELSGVDSVFALHCDPRVEVGRVGLRAGAITAAADAVDVHLTGPGGHTARPHLTVDLVHALGRVATQVPEMLSRLVDPRAGLTLVWGAVRAGVAANTVPQSGVLRGTIRMLSRDAWEEAPTLLERLVQDIVAPTGATATVHYVRGVPPVINDPGGAGIMRSGVTAALGAAAVVDTPQSLGGEDFAWYLEHVPGALARLGVRRPGPLLDLHQGNFDIDERALALGVKVLVHTVLTALRR